jgi:hypothetical protein
MLWQSKNTPAPYHSSCHLWIVRGRKTNHSPRARMALLECKCWRFVCAILVLLVVAPATGVVTMHTCANFSCAIAYAR